MSADQQSCRTWPAEKRSCILARVLVPERPNAIAVAVACSLASACSALAVRESDCKTDQECVDAFGPGYVCAVGGSCERMAPDESDGTGTDTDPSTGTGLATETGDETDGCPPEGCPIPIADECSDPDIPVLPSSSDFVVVDTTELRNDFDELGCLEVPPAGNDGFFAVEMSAGERWHFHVRVTDDTANPAVYVLPGCDERSCQSGDGVDLCGAGSDEHVSFTADEAGVYLVGVDDRSAGGAVLNVLAIQPTCGSGGTPEHSESCDDGNTVSGDGCDARCRAELTAAANTEVEPNDDKSAANVLVLDEDSDALTVAGAVGGRCDFDNYLVTVPEDGRLRATVQAPGGQPCNNTAPQITLRLLAPDGFTVMGEGRSRGGNGCPSIDDTDMFATALEAGDYFVRVFTGEAEETFEYELAVEVGGA